MAVVFGLLAAVAYGAADFLGGLSSRRSPLAAVLVVSQLSSLGVLALLVAASAPEAPLRRDVLLGAAAGVALGAGLVLLYRGLAVGRMSVVAPITAVGAALLPVAWGVGTGERPSVGALGGAAAALAGIVLVSRSPGEGTAPGSASRRHLEPVLALGAGAGFGSAFILLGSTSAQAGFWPLAGARPVTVAVLAAGALVAGQGVRPRRVDVPLVVLTGTLDMAANAFYLVAVRGGLLSLVAVLVSLYPATTVLLARVVLDERITGIQWTGLALAGAGVALIASG